MAKPSMLSIVLATILYLACSAPPVSAGPLKYWKREDAKAASLYALFDDTHKFNTVNMLNDMKATWPRTPASGVSPQFKTANPWKTVKAGTADKNECPYHDCTTDPLQRVDLTAESTSLHPLNTLKLCVCDKDTITSVDKSFQSIAWRSAVEHVNNLPYVLRKSIRSLTVLQAKESKTPAAQGGHLVISSDVATMKLQIFEAAVDLLNIERKLHTQAKFKDALKSDTCVAVLSKTDQDSIAFRYAFALYLDRFASRALKTTDDSNRATAFNSANLGCMFWQIRAIAILLGESNDLPGPETLYPLRLPTSQKNQWIQPVVKTMPCISFYSRIQRGVDDTNQCANRQFGTLYYISLKKDQRSTIGNYDAEGRIKDTCSKNVIDSINIAPEVFNMGSYDTNNVRLVYESKNGDFRSEVDVLSLYPATACGVVKIASAADPRVATTAT
ncbi:hypothetical protein CXG81DRAFT_18641 [Caulochytrium protostelioides]|uniref:Uncharacterized protein n=1 Tax=Caulochytrium protostelioides TaxID=1555241 RepID=A0A4V1ITS1_9FUNG|nr:hypothetical protein CAUPRSCDRAFT_10336 [Caulochytrium protostelioides]RKP01590.1 hypothetical protein CXG81DRAFT_18641 [Caulochytrium protostelioides]|eukprot:RKP01590.1 hypothetical protein CXG81DRAFT_18641 [Caulochytrium protostelioides]